MKKKKIILYKKIIQGSHASWKYWKVLEFQTYGFKAWKVLENNHRSLKVLELNFEIIFMALFQKWSDMCCPRQNETALMIGVEMGSTCVLMHSLEFS